MSHSEMTRRELNAAAGAVALSVYFGLAPNQDEISGIDHSPGYLRNAAKMLAGG